MSAQRKLEVLRVVEGSDLPVRDALARLDLARSTYYRWRRLLEPIGNIPPVELEMAYYRSQQTTVMVA